MKKYRQDNDEQKKDKRTNNDLQTNKQKTNDRTTRTPLKSGGELMCFGRVLNICLTNTIPYTKCIRLCCSFLSNGNCPQVSANTPILRMCYQIVSCRSTQCMYKHYDHRAQSPELPSIYIGGAIPSSWGSGETDYIE